VSNNRYEFIIPIIEALLFEKGKIHYNDIIKAMNLEMTPEMKGNLTHIIATDIIPKMVNSYQSPTHGIEILHLVEFQTLEFVSKSRYSRFLSLDKTTIEMTDRTRTVLACIIFKGPITMGELTKYVGECSHFVRILCQLNYVNFKLNGKCNYIYSISSKCLELFNANSTKHLKEMLLGLSNEVPSDYTSKDREIKSLSRISSKLRDKRSNININTIR
jgi:chromosome segregation and condensation protein ScpB